MMFARGRAMGEHQNPGQAVQAAAARDHGWKLTDVRVGEVKELKRGGCAFFRASDPTRVGQAPADYAVLPGGQLAKGATEVLRQCGQGAPGEWWAQVIARFGGVPGILVDKHAPSAIRKIRAAGEEWKAPELVASGGTTALTFYTVEYELGRVYRVQASLPARGALSVKQEQIAPSEMSH